MSKRFYAVAYAYGRHTINTNGNRADQVRAFASRKWRDAWVDEIERRGYEADALPANNKLVRKWIRYGEPAND